MSQDPKPEFRIARRRHGDAEIVHLEGDATKHAAPAIRDELNSALATHAPTVVLDLCDAKSAESSVFHTILNAHRRLVRQGRRLVIACPPGPLLRLFETNRLVGTFEMHPTLDAALAA